MPGCSWKTWLLLAVLTVRGSASLPRRPLAFGEAVELGVAVYNSQAGEDARYRLLEAVPQPEWVRTPRRRPTVTFRLSFPRGWVEENLTSLWEAAVRKNRGEKKREVHPSWSPAVEVSKEVHGWSTKTMGVESRTYRGGLLWSHLREPLAGKAGGGLAPPGIWKREN